MLTGALVSLQMSFTQAPRRPGRKPSTASVSPTTGRPRPQICVPASAGLARPSSLRFSFQRSSSDLSTKELGWGGNAPTSIVDLADLTPVELEAGERSPVLDHQRRLFDVETSARALTTQALSTDPLHMMVGYIRHAVSASSKASSAARRPTPGAGQFAVFCAFWLALAFFVVSLFGQHFASPAQQTVLADPAHDPYHLLRLGPHYVSSPGAESTQRAAGSRPQPQKLWTDIAREGGHTAPHIVYPEHDDYTRNADRWANLMAEFQM